MKWIQIRKEFPIEFKRFIGCHNRVHEGKTPSMYWPRDSSGFFGWLSDIGPIPSHLEKPSVGRIDHSKGYVPGNMRWEEHRLNSIKRSGTKYENSTIDEMPEVKTPKFKKGSPGYFEHQAKASNARWAKPGAKKKASEFMSGNFHAIKIGERV